MLSHTSNHVVDVERCSCDLVIDDSKVLKKVLMLELNNNLGDYITEAHVFMNVDNP